MTCNQISVAGRFRPAYCEKVAFFDNLFTKRSIVLFVFFISSMIVQHVAEQFSNGKKMNSTFSSSSQFYSIKTSKERFIPEASLKNLKDNPLVVHTANGPVLGKRSKTFVQTSSKTDEHYEIDAFLGLPYGRAPINELRFQKPKPLDKPWFGFVFNATIPSDSCIQLNDSFFGNFRGSTMWNPNTPLSEDCLTANIWAPSKRLSEPRKLLPVMVWIYGGAFHSGTIAMDLYDGAIFASRSNLMVISINYRAASFGFLYLDRKDAPGNVGIVDQILALEWIKKNVRSFGGDPDRITLFGESAGAATISFLLISPQIRSDLFHRAILQSGASTSPWALVDHETAIYRGLRLAENVGCIKANSKYELNKRKEIVEIQDLRRYKDYDYKNDPKLIECLQKVDALELISNEPNNTRVIEFPFVPVVDGYVLPEEPSELLKKHNFKQIPVLLGSVKNEASYFLVYALNELREINKTIDLNKKVLENIIRKNFDNEDDLILDAIVQQYTNWQDPDNVEINLEILDHVFGDNRFSCPMNLFARSYAESNLTVYQYMFAHRSSYSPWPKWMGVLHADEINFIFGEPLRDGYDKYYSKPEIELSERMMAFWTNFALTGDPLKSGNNLPQLNIPIKDDEWLPVTSRNSSYKILNTNIKNSLQFGPPRPDHCSFWLDYLPKFRAKIKQRQLCNNSAAGTNLRLVLLLSTIAYLLNVYRSRF